MKLRHVWKYLLLLTLFCGIPVTASAIYIGNLTFSLPSEQDFVSKNVLNNNQSARVYQVNIVRIDTPSEQETRTRPADGELLYAPHILALSPGQADVFKFYYHGPKDDIERYYRVSFHEIPSESRSITRGLSDKIIMDPVVIMDSILVVRPRNVRFKWDLNKSAGTLTNSGNTYFKVLLKQGCDSTEEDSESGYLRPGETLKSKLLQQLGEKLIIYNDQFISISDECRK